MKQERACNLIQGALIWIYNRSNFNGANRVGQKFVCFVFFTKVWHRNISCTSTYLRNSRFLDVRWNNIATLYVQLNISDYGVMGHSRMLVACFTYT